MLAYAANRPRIAQRCSSPNAMLVVIGAHVALIAAVMSAKMDLPIRPPGGPIIIESIPEPPPPPNEPLPQTPRPQPGPTVLQDSTPPLPNPIFPTLPTADPGPVADPGTVDAPTTNANPGPVGMTWGAQLLTPASELKPPYPPSKLLNEEEAALRLRLTIDRNGRVIAVDPVGRADPAFLEAARRHLIAHWRYWPAMEDGQPVASSAVITLRFELDG